jgi:hypothetical protein
MLINPTSGHFNVSTDFAGIALGDNNNYIGNGFGQPMRIGSWNGIDFYNRYSNNGVLADRLIASLSTAGDLAVNGVKGNQISPASEAYIKVKSKSGNFAAGDTAGILLGDNNNYVVSTVGQPLWVGGFNGVSLYQRVGTTDTLLMKANKDGINFSVPVNLGAIASDTFKPTVQAYVTVKSKSGNFAAKDTAGLLIGDGNNYVAATFGQPLWVGGANGVAFYQRYNGTDTTRLKANRDGLVPVGTNSVRIMPKEESYNAGKMAGISLGDESNYVAAPFGDSVWVGGYHGVKLYQRVNGTTDTLLMQANKDGITVSAPIRPPTRGYVTIGDDQPGSFDEDDTAGIALGDSNNFVFTTVGKPVYVEGFNGVSLREKKDEVLVAKSSGVSTKYKMTASGGFSCASDQRLKKNITPVGNALQKIMELSGVSFNWKTDPLGRKKELGLIAQQVEKVAPELVSTGAEGYKMMNYDGLAALFVNSIKEQQEQINELKRENQELKQLIKTSCN